MTTGLLRNSTTKRPASHTSPAYGPVPMPPTVPSPWPCHRSFMGRSSARPTTSRSCSISSPMPPNRWACRLSTSIVGCRGQLSRLRRQKRSSSTAAIPMSRQSHQGHDQHQRRTEILSEQTVRSPTKGFWEPTFPTLPTWQCWFAKTSDTFSRRPCRLLGSAFRLDLSGMRFGMVCVGNGVRITVF